MVGGATKPQPKLREKTAIYLGSVGFSLDSGKHINRSYTHTHTPTENNTPDTHTHTRQEHHPKPPNEHPPQTLNNARRWRLITLEGGAMTVTQKKRSMTLLTRLTRVSSFPIRVYAHGEGLRINHLCRHEVNPTST